MHLNLVYFINLSSLSFNPNYDSADCKSKKYNKKRKEILLNPSRHKEIILLKLRNHQNIKRVFFLNFSHIFVFKHQKEKHYKKFPVRILETGGGLKK